MRGVLRFNVGSVPVAVMPWFWVTTVVIWFFGLNDTFRFGDLRFLFYWVAVAFVSILFHELGHAWAFRRCGSAPAVALHGMGGHCTGWANSDLQSAGVSFAGPAAGLLIGAPVWWLNRQGLLPFNLDLRVAASYWIWVNVFWSFFNLLPVLPLDGGGICRGLLSHVAARDVTRTAQQVSLVVAPIAVVLAFVYLPGRTAIWILMILGLAFWGNLSGLRNHRSTDSFIPIVEGIGMEISGTSTSSPMGSTRVATRPDNVVSMSEARKKRKKLKPDDHIRVALQALEWHDPDGALNAVRSARSKKPGGKTEILLDELEAWSWLAKRDAEQARLAIATIPPKSPSLAFLEPALAMVRGDRDQGARDLAAAIVSGEQSHSSLFGAEVAANEGATADVVKAMLHHGSQGFETALFLQRMLERLGRNNHAAIVDDVLLSGGE